MKSTFFPRALIGVLLLVLLPTAGLAEGLISGKSFGEANEIIVEFAAPVDPARVLDTSNYIVFEENDPDIRLELEEVILAPDNRSAVLKFKDPLNTTLTHIVTMKGVSGKEAESFSVAKSYFG